MKPTVAKFFQSGDSQRDKFLARLFGIFNEDLVRDWCTDPRSPYEDRGRPTLRSPGDTRGATLDFTFRHRVTRETYVAEMKVELEYEGYRYITLERIDQLEHHRLRAFQRFLAVAREPRAHEVRVGGKPVPVDGAILIWGAVKEDSKQLVLAETGIYDVLSMDSIVDDLRAWAPARYIERVAALRQAANDLFDWLS